MQIYSKINEGTKQQIFSHEPWWAHYKANFFGEFWQPWPGKIGKYSYKKISKIYRRSRDSKKNPLLSKVHHHCRACQCGHSSLSRAPLLLPIIPPRFFPPWDGPKKDLDSIVFWNEWRKKISFSELISRGQKVSKEGRVGCSQCDQIWQNFNTLAKVYKCLEIFDSLFLICQKAEATLTNLWNYWANCHCYKWPNIEK